MTAPPQPSAPPPLTTDECLQIVDQALVLIEQLYVHLPLKRAMHAVEPIQRLKLLKQRAKGLSERAFHDEMVSIFTHLRDLHTTYILPDWFRNRVAFLPFRIQEFFEGDDGPPQYMVTQVKPGAVSPNSGDKEFKEGAIVTHWNGIPIRRAVEINAEREAGSNLEARRARGLEAMTIRPMDVRLPPDEQWVVVSYKPADSQQTREIRFDWKVMKLEESVEGLDPLSQAVNPLFATGEEARVLGVDATSDLERRARKKLFKPDAVAVEKQVAGLVGDTTAAGAGAPPDPVVKIDFTRDSKIPRVFSFRREVKSKSGTFGYIRIRSFNYQNDDKFVEEFVRIAGLMPPEGLILDARGNGGGNIICAERLLQVLTPHRIDPELLHFINTSLTFDLCASPQNDFISTWRDSIGQAVETGATFSQGFPLLSADKYNNVGQKYQGPVVLLINALCYSATDIFTAGFQDHKIGVVLGTSGNTGAGGANVWSLTFLQNCLPGEDSPFRTMPQNASFLVAVRRTTRVGERSGVPVEDLGITPDVTYRMSKDDLLKGDVDLLEKAGKILKGLTVYSLSAEVRTNNNAPSNIVITSKNITRVDPVVDGRPYQTINVEDGANTRDLPTLPAGSKVLELRGFRDDQLVVSTRVNL